MKPVWVAPVLGLATVAMTAIGASADDPHGSAHMSPEQGGVTVEITNGYTDPADSDSNDAGTVEGVATVDIGTVLFDDFCSGINYTPACDPAGAHTAPVVSQAITQSLVLGALRRVDLPASKLQVQPPGGETLVNFETNFFTEQEPFTRTVRLLGQRVDLKIWPSQFRWVFGDGAELASVGAGSPYPDLEITHDYARKGGVSPRVDTTYAAQFRVNGGAWRDVDGTVTIPGAPVQLEVRTATPVLVGYR